MADSQKITKIRHHALGVIGILLLLVGAYFSVNRPEVESLKFLHGSCIKVGLVLIAAWLAFPQLQELPVWMFGGVLLGIIVVAARPQIIPILFRVALFLSPLLFVIWLLRAKPKKGTTG